MPRRALLWLTAAVLALHWLVLRDLPLGGSDADAGAPQPLAFQTRMVEPPPPPPPPAPPPAQDPAPAPPPRPAPVRKPPPPPAPAPVPAPAPAPAPQEPEPVAEGQDMPPPAPAAAADPVSPDDGVHPPADPAMAAASSVQAPAAQPAEPTTAAAAAPEPVAAASAAEAPEASDAGLDIRPPGAAGNTAAGAPPPVKLPAPARLAFDVSGQAKRFNYNASAELVWRHDGAVYEARQEVKAFLLGSRAQTSRGQITAAGLQPERFGDKSRSEQAAHFDFGAGKVVFSANTPQAAISAGAQDRLSVFIQLGALLAAAPDRYPPGTRITLTTVSARNADRWTFTVEGAETLELPAGPTPALKLQRLPRKDHDQKAELWLGTQLGYLPVRIRLTQSNGDYADLRLSGHSTP